MTRATCILAFLVKIKALKDGSTLGFACITINHNSSEFGLQMSIGLNDYNSAPG